MPTLWTRWRTALVRWSVPQVQPLAHTGRVPLRRIHMRHQYRTVLVGIRALAIRLETPLRLAYYVLPPTLTGRRARERAEPTPQPNRPRARIIVNPTSGSIHGEFGLNELDEAAAWLTEQGLPTEVCLTQRPGHAQELARAAARAGMDLVVAAGGDGTVNSVVQGLAGTQTALGVLPMGTVNVWAREMGIPLNTTLAREVLVEGVRRRMDLGRAGSRHFLLMAGIGFDAEVARRVEHSRLKRLGLKLVDYFATAGRLSVTEQPAKVWMRCDGKRRSVSALMIIIGNTRLYGGALTFAKKAVADDGWLDLVIMGGGSIPYRADVFLRALLRRASLGPHVRYARCRMVRFESNRPLPVQVDGEVIGTLPMTFSIAPSALTVVVPANAPADLFSKPPLTV